MNYGDTNPLMRASVAYLEIAFGGKYNIDKLNDDELGKLLFLLAKEFKNIINNKIE